MVNTGLFLHDRFVYLMNVNYAAQGEDARGVTYVHGYCFSVADYYELCADPAKICAVTEESFPLEYDDKIIAYPVVNELKYVSLSFCGITGEISSDRRRSTGCWYWELLMLLKLQQPSLHPSVPAERAV